MHYENYRIFLGLTLPFLQFPQRKEIIVNGAYLKPNTFTTLPADIDKLNNLQGLLLRRGELKTLPEFIGSLSNLARSIHTSRLFSLCLVCVSSNRVCDGGA